MSEADQNDNEMWVRLEPLLSIVCCPRTKGPLRPMTTRELSESLTEPERRRIPEGTTGALVAEGSAVAYPIVGQIIDFLEQDALRLSQIPQDPSMVEDSRSSSVKSDVKSWYDNFGWKRTENGTYGDTALFSQGGQTAHRFYEMDSHLQFLDCLGGGTFLLDAASGAIAQPEYEPYSWYYRYRVCVDISSTALREAAAKIGSRGFCCMADLCRLPFRDNVFDGIVSGYTIQHIPESDQQQAIRELGRVLAPGRHCCITTDLVVSFPGRVMRRLMQGLLRTSHTNTIPSGSGPASIPQPPPLYFHNHSRRWWRNAISQLDCHGSVETLRLFHKSEFERFFGDSWRAARACRRIERALPRLSAPFAWYGLIRLLKTARPDE